MIDKICFFTTEFAPNRQAILKYMEKILPQEVKIYLFTPKNEKQKYLLKRTIIVDTKCNKYYSFFELRNFCRKEKINHLINLGVLPQEGFVMFFATIFTKTDFMMHQLGNPIDAPRITKGRMKLKTLMESIFFNLLFLFSKKTFLCLRSMETFYKKRFFPLKDRISYLPHLIDTSVFKPREKIICRKKLKIHHKDKIILFAGRIEYLKGADIIYKIAQLNPDKKFILIGDLKDDNYKDFPLPNICLIPKILNEKIIDYYNAADLCLFPSRLEGIPVVPREAMSCGIPTIMTNIRSAKEIDGVIIVQQNLKKIQREIIRFFNQSGLEKEKISKHSRNSIIENYSIKKWEKQVLNLILN